MGKTIKLWVPSLTVVKILIKSLKKKPENHKIYRDNIFTLPPELINKISEYF